MEKYALMAAAFGALAITAASGLLIIPALRRLHFGQTIKEIGPTWHQGKNGTPTMGGLTFYLGVLVGVVLGYTVLALSVPSLLGGWLSGTSVCAVHRRADGLRLRPGGLCGRLYQGGEKAQPGPDGAL